MHYLYLLGLGTLIGGLLSGPILGLVLPIIAGAFAKPVADLVTIVTRFENSLPAPLKTIVVGIVGVVFGVLASLIPGFPSDISGLNAQALAALLSGGVAILAHHSSNIQKSVQAAHVTAQAIAKTVGAPITPAPANRNPAGTVGGGTTIGGVTLK